MSIESYYDVCLLLEGTFPFVSGGVSTWVYNLIKALPEIHFTGVSIVPVPEDKCISKYDLPKNFRDMKIVSLQDHRLEKQQKTNNKIRLQQIDMIRSFHHKMFEKDSSIFSTILPIFQSAEHKGLTPHDMMYGKDAWKLLLEFYNPEENKDSFIDYFWTYRITHLPIFKILYTEIPKAKVYHAVSTGYAGLLGVMAKHLNQKPFLLTEHGIYSKERKIDIVQTEWIYVPGSEQFRVQKDLGAFQKMWINLFESLARMAYVEADRIVTLFEGNRQMEIAQGANPNKTFIVPNGIDIETFSSLKPDDMKTDEGAHRPFHIGFVGRVVPIKDIKTFLRACKIVVSHLPDIKISILGSQEEEPSYFRECQELVQLLGITGHVAFTGEVNVTEYYPKLDLIVLTSISEAQPLVILEANCAGIPVVATDVGACCELLEGRTEKDRAIGPSGIITRLADPAETAKAIITVLTDDKLRQEMSVAGRKRVETFYREKDLHQRYKDLYEEFMGI